MYTVNISTYIIINNIKWKILALPPKKIITKNKIIFLPTDPIFFGHVTLNTVFILFGLRIPVSQTYVMLWREHVRKWRST